MDSDSSSSSEYVFKEDQQEELVDMSSKPTTPAISAVLWKTMKDNGLVPIQVHVQNLTFKVITTTEAVLPFMKKKIEKTVLSGISSTFEPGTVTAIMGSSGAGKTSLLNVLAGRAVGKMEGQILYNGCPINDAKHLYKRRAYVMQDDVMLFTQTPKEILEFAANLRMPRSSTPEQRIERASGLIDRLNINYCQNTQVGAPGIQRGISGGEKKRVAIGTELITNPSLLFLDEPTSGLDSETAENVMEILRVLARQGRTIICTIHQPNSFIWIELIHFEQSDPNSEQKILKLIDSWYGSPNFKQSQKVELLQLQEETKEDADENEHASFVTQVKCLLKRSISDNMRNSLKTKASLAQCIFLGLIIGLTYLRLGKSQSEIQSRLGALFFILLNQIMSSAYSTVNTFHIERAVLLRETKNSMYSAYAYYVSKFIADFPLEMLFPIVFVSITYWMVGLNDDFGSFITVLVAIIIGANIGNGIGISLGLLVPDAAAAVTLLPPTVLPFIIFSGYLINRDNVPPYFIWADYISFFKYVLQIGFVETLSGIKFTCKESERLSNGECPIVDGDQIIRTYDYDEISVGACFAILIGIYVMVKLLNLILLVRRVKNSPANV